MWTRDNPNPDGEEQAGLAAADIWGGMCGEPENALKGIGECDLNTVLEMYHYTNGTILELNGYLGDAIREYREAICLNPDEGFYHYNLGVALLKNNEFNDAYKELCEAIRLNPEDYESRCALGDVYCAIGKSQLAGGKPDDAMDSFREAIKIDPDYPDYHSCLGQALLERAKSGAEGIDEEQLNGAVAEFRAAIDIDPDCRDAQVNMGKALSLSSSEDKRAEGIQLLNELLLADPFNDDVKSCIEALTADSHET